MFIMGITIIFLLFFVVISFVVFLAQPKAVAPELVFNRPKVNIDMAVFDSDQFKNLQAFTQMETQYSYTAVTKNNKQQTGFISAVSADQARAILIGMGLAVTDLKEAEIGRDNPFSPYYQQVTTTSKTNK